MPSLFAGHRNVVPQHVPPRIYRRVPFETSVRLKFDRFQGFVEQYCGNLSLGGMFVNSDEPPPLGTEVAIEFQLEDGFELIRGRGRVAWVRAPGDGGEPGFGLRFLELTPGSRELIFRLVERRVREGDRVFDLEGQAPATAAALLVHDEEHARLVDDEDRALDERGAAPPWDRPAPRPAEAAAAGGPVAAAAGGEVVRYGRAAREAAEAEAGDAPPAQVVAEPVDAEPVDAEQVDAEQVAGAHVEEAHLEVARSETPPVEPSPDAAAPVEAVRDEAVPPVDGDAAGATIAGVEDPEASFAGLVDDDEEAADGAGAARGDDLWIASAAAGAPPAMASGRAGGAAAAAGSPPPSPGEEAGTAAASEATAGAEAGARPVRSRRGLRLALAIAAGIAVLALVAFLLLRTRDAGALGDRTAGEPFATPAATAAEESAEAPQAADGARPEDGASRADAAAPAAGPRATHAADPAGAASAGGPGTIERIAWQRRDGGVDFEIAGGGPIAPALVDHFTVGGERPRLVVRIAGVERPYPRGDLAVGGPLVERVRTGFHPAAAGAASSLHVVFDLTAPAAAAAVDTAGGRVHVRFEER